MPLSLLFDHFDRLITRPGDLPRLNQTILQLAVQGQLVPQNPADEPASELLQRIRAEKERLLLTGQLRRDEPLPPISQDEIPYMVSDSWLWVRFGEVTINRDSERIPLSKEQRQNRKGDFDYYGASGVIDKIDDYLFDKPLLLIGEDGANLINRSTPIAFIAHGKYWVNNHAHVVDAIDFALLKYLEVYINAIDLKPYVTGTAQPKMNQAKMNSVLIALPPLAEQKRIVAKVEALLAQSQALAAELAAAEAEQSRLSRASLHHLLAAPTPTDFAPRWHFVASHFDAVTPDPESVDELKQAILQLAVQGKLVEQDSNDAPTVDLIDRIEAERLALKPSNQDEKIILTELAQLRRELQKDSSTQVYITARCVCDFITKGTTPDTKEFSQNGDIPYLKVYNIVNNEIDFFYKPSYISKSVHETQLKRSKVFPEDVLMNIVGPPLGKVAIVPYDFEEWNTNQALAIFRPIRLLDNRFLYYTLSCFATLETVLRDTRGTAGQDNLSLEQCRDLNIPLYSLSQSRGAAGAV